MSNLFALIVGAITTIVVSFYFYKQGLKKKLTAHIYDTRHVLIVAPSIRKVAKSYYKDIPVIDVFRIQLLIVNDGRRAILDFIEPLTLPTPNKPKLLDARVIYKNPEQISSDFTINNSTDGVREIEFRISLLNKDWLFYVELVFDGFIYPEDLEFNLMVEDLPSTIRPIYSSLSASEARKTNRWMMGAVAVICLFLSAVLFLAVQAYFQTANLLALNTLRAWLVLSIPGLPLVISLSIFFVMIIEAVLTLKKRKRYAMPVHLRD